MAINSKAKGSRGERHLAKCLETWANMEFARVPSSGGLHWKGRPDTSGDITCITKEGKFPFSVECKSYCEINFQHLLYLEKCDIYKFWDQCKGDAVQHKLNPLLFMRYNGLPRDFYFVAISNRLYTILEQIDNQIGDHLHVSFGKYNFYIITSTDLFHTNYNKILNYL